MFPKALNLYHGISGRRKVQKLSLLLCLPVDSSLLECDNTNFKKIYILSIYTIWNRFSRKTISRYCPFKVTRGLVCIKQPMHLWFIQTHAQCFRCVDIQYLGKCEGLGRGNRESFGPRMALAYRLAAISPGPKNLLFKWPNPLPLALVMDIHASKTLCTGLY